MSKPVNLNQYRKARARKEKRAQADENAVRFGRSKMEKDLDTARARKAREALDGNRRDE